MISLISEIVDQIHLLSIQQCFNLHNNKIAYNLAAIS